MTLRWRKVAVYLWRVMLSTAVVLLVYEQFLSTDAKQQPTTSTGSNSKPVQLENSILSLAPMLKNVVPAVVNITTIGVEKRDTEDGDGLRYYLDNPSDEEAREFRNLGSGVIVDAELGYVITNFHVVEDATQIVVVLNDERQVTARLLGSDPNIDVAVLKIDPEALSALPFGDSSDLEVGDFVVAVGNPFGLRHSVSLGIVSALGRYGIQGTGFGIEDYIQTDAPINPGNSGGALVNTRGELVGLNTAIYSRSGANAGIGFAIPTSKLQSIMEQLLMYGSVQRGKFGVITEPLNNSLRLRFGLANNAEGIVVTQVEAGSLARRTGIRPGDIIRSINGTEIDTQQTLRNATGLLLAGQLFTIEVDRGSQQLNFQTRFPQPTPTHSAGDFIHPKLSGAEFRDLPLAEQIGPASGVLVQSVRNGTAAWHANLRPGDLILQVNGTFIDGMASFREALRDANNRLQLLVQSGQQVYDVTLR